ncbi:sulfurtransferase TusA family protein [Microbulbifer sp. SA54]|uniref:sulfurtransferase TusA family protein n=1 Tax=Microbulbifer sp. SA54 TaxID=3401577 RepID=UPI003AAC1981
MTGSDYQATSADQMHGKPALRVDARGLPCPQPLLAMRRALRQVEPGALVHVVATDPASQRDFRSFAELSGTTMVREERRGMEFHYWLQGT